ncbi:hypothetical protein Agub_g12762 [Astrephomene gubernaculifera]|uniref:Uncharacterized protein n=1 Tax=Astrephomene gubernaculifera TaxID=47775 RepID=A0AAD3HRT0_9CHLO|nr:hypothetical protein Agub_g12762 [Astrephomene gubernaculifera]
MNSVALPGGGTSTSLNPFASILTAAQQAGVPLPKTATPLPSLVTASSSLVEAADAHHSVLCKVQSLRAQKDAPHAADASAQQALCKLLHVANTNNRTIVKGQQEIAARVRALKTKECIPIERQHQEEFVSLLRSIFQSGPLLQQLYEDIAWSLSTPEAGAAWENRLEPLLAVVASSQAYEAGLNQQDQLLSRLPAVGMAPGGAPL